MLVFDEYTGAFNFYGPNVSEREKIIEDGAEDQYVMGEDGEPTKELTELCKLARQEQSDMVVVLLNLAYIPDWVIQHPDMHFRPGWSMTFKSLMDQYKANWEEEHGKKWTF